MAVLHCWYSRVWYNSSMPNKFNPGLVPGKSLSKFVYAFVVLVAVFLIIAKFAK